MNDNENNTSKGGTGFCSLLTIAFIVLKLTKVIDWSWLWVLAPLWITFAVYVLISIILVIVVNVHDKNANKR